MDTEFQPESCHLSQQRCYFIIFWHLPLFFNFSSHLIVVVFLKVLCYFSLVAFKIFYLTLVLWCFFAMCLGLGLFLLFLLGMDGLLKTEIYDFNEYRKSQSLCIKIFIFHHPSIFLVSPWGVTVRDIFGYLILSFDIS